MDAVILFSGLFWLVILIIAMVSIYLHKEDGEYTGNDWFNRIADKIEGKR